MASIKDLKKRITSVKNTQQTTKAMKMVSAAKLRRAQEAILSQRPFAKKLADLIQLVAAGLASDDYSKLIAKPASESISALPKATLLVVTSDRGLCGGFNATIIKATARWL